MRDYLELREAQAARQARRSLFDFAKLQAPTEYRFNWHHALIYRYLDDFSAGRRKRVLIQAPPGHGKSEGVSRNLPAYILGQNPNARVIACSYTSDLASEMNRDVQRIIDSPRYATVFPKTRLNSGNVRTLVGVPRRNSDIFDIVGYRGFYKAAGVGQGISGRRFDFGIIDDPIKDRETANSAAMREAIWRWYTSVFHSRRAKDAGILLTLTRWHEDDLAGRILANAAEPWDVLTLPAVATGIEQHPDDPRKPGEALWPWFRPVEELERIRQLEPRDYDALYQQNPRPEGGTEFPAEWFGKRIWFDDWPRDLTVRALALDPSKGKDAKHGDYSAWVWGGLDRATSTLYVDADLKRRPTPRIVEDGIGHHQNFGPQGIAVEINQFQELLAVEFARVAKERGLGLPLYGITNTVSKAVRIRTIGPHLARGEVRFKAGSPGARLLVQQLRDFPTADHDDGPDALEMLIRMIWHLLGQKSNNGQPKILRT